MRIVAPLLLVACAAGSYGVRVQWLDKQYEARREKLVDSDSLRSPGRDVLRLASFGHALAGADVMLLSIVQELGKGADASPATWDRVERWADIATDLDPRYFQPYYVSALQLALYGKRADSSDRLLLKGWKEMPAEWQFPFLLGYNAYFLRAEPVLAADYMIEASELQGSPPYLVALAGRMRFHAGDETGAIELLQEMIPHLDGVTREHAEQRLAMLKSEPRLALYDQACKKYLAERGTLPLSAEELRQYAQISEPATDELGYPISLDINCVATTELITTREFEAKERVGQDLKPKDETAPQP